MSAIINAFAEVNTAVVALFLTLEALYILISPMTAGVITRICMAFAKKYYTGSEKNMIKAAIVIVIVTSVPTVIYYGAVVLLGGWMTLAALVCISIPFAYITGQIVARINQDLMFEVISRELKLV